MKKNIYILLFAGIIMIVIGLTYNSIFHKSTESIEYTGKYYKSNDSIYIYKIDDENLYFVINDNIYGKATFNDNEANGIISNKKYKFTLNDNKLVLESNDSNIDGEYIKDSSITLEEFYNSKYGNYELLNTMYSAKYSNSMITIVMCQIKDNEVIAFINKNNDKLLLKFTFNEIGHLRSTYGDDGYVISVRDNSIMYTKEGLLEFFQEELPFQSKITSQDVFDLFIEYQ